MSSLINAVKSQWAGFTLVIGILWAGWQGPGWVEAQVKSKVDSKTKAIVEASERQTKETKRTREELTAKAARIEQKLDKLMLELIRQRK